jgi:hypothetical protein
VGGCSFGSLTGELALMRDRGDLRLDADLERLTFALMAALEGRCCSPRPRATPRRSTPR